MAVTINLEQRLFVIPCGPGYTCFGFDNCYRDSVVMAQMMSVEPPDALSIGTMVCYNAYKALCVKFGKHPASKDTWFTPGTPAKVRSILKAAIRSYKTYGAQGQILRFMLGDPKTGRDYCEENDVVGFVGRSTGSQKVPLLIEPLTEYSGHLTSASGGSALLTALILRIIDVRNGKLLYSSTNYQPPLLVIEADTSIAALPFLVRIGGQTHARFPTHGSACKHVAFLEGALPANAFRTAEELKREFAEND
jgi:hypothetical protein